MTGLSMQACSPRELKENIIDVLKAGLVSFTKSSPGMGKSSIIYQIAEEYNLKALDTRLSTKAPEDLSGLPSFFDSPMYADEPDENGNYPIIGYQKKAQFVPFENFPVEGDPLPINPKTGKRYDGWLIFFDEFNSGSKSIQAAAYQIILDRLVGLRKLHPRAFMVCAGNLSTDRAIVNPLSTAMQSRLIHLKLELNNREWMEDVAYKHNYDSRIISFLNYMPSKLMDFRPDHTEETFCCPRTWSFMNDLVKGKEFDLYQDPKDGTWKFTMEKKANLYSGTITSGVAIEFIQHAKLHKNLPNINDIIGNPATLPLPVDNGLMYATIIHLMEHANEKNFTEITTYINRFTPTMRVVFFRGIPIRHPALRQHPMFMQSMLELDKYIND